LNSLQSFPRSLLIKFFTPYPPFEKKDLYHRERTILRKNLNQDHYLDSISVAGWISGKIKDKGHGWSSHKKTRHDGIGQTGSTSTSIKGKTTVARGQ
jgi:hypothetical protein